MPRRKPIRMIPIDWPHLPEAIEGIANSRGSRREDYFAFVTDRLDLIENARLAVVTISVQPTSGKRSIHGHGPGRRATVMFPFEKATNEALKAKLTSILIEFDGFAKGWVFGAHTDSMVERIMTVLLKYFEIVIVDEFGKYALLYK
jgi:hypothetical protein